MLTIDNVSKNFAGVRAVDGCSFQVETGKITGLIGPNGAGKTTLFNIVAGFIKPTDGSITLKDQDVTGLRPHQLFKLGVVRTFQIPREFGRMTVLENLMIVPPKQLGENLIASWLRWREVLAEETNIRRKAEEVLDYLNLSHLRNELAQGMSGGQKKLLELGRTLMIDPEVILLDEPGAGVNKTLLRELAEIIERLNQERNCTFCIIDHDLDLIDRLCDHVVVMAQGKVLSQGTMATVRQNSEVQQAYLGNV
ncbi:MAG TPA: ABC transporter ATP-binding protein [Leptolyngbyaceae cyanobacterium]